MSGPRPQEFYRDGEALRPINAALFARQYDEGEIHTLAPWAQRSQASHSHFFACVDDAWENLPEDLASHFSSPDQLRKWALIKKGYCTTRTVVTETDDEAIKLSGFIHTLDEHALVSVAGNVVKVWVAASQSLRAMGRQKFEQSKTDVLDVLAEMLDVDPETLRTQGGMSA